MSDSLAEIPVSEADAETRAVYDQIMAATDVGSPALIYRYLAVTPGLLNWVWDLAGPDVESGHVTAHALAAAGRVSVLSLPPIGAADFAACGVDAGGQRMIDAMLATYNRMNPVNLALISAVRDLIKAPTDDSKTATVLPAAAPLASGAKAIELPAPVNVAAMPADLQRLVGSLSATIPSPDGSTITPTLYRHFAHYPAFLRLIVPMLQAAIDSGAVAERMAQLQIEMQPLIDDVTFRARGQQPPPPPLADTAPTLQTLDSFLIMIPQLIVIGTGLAAAIAAGRAS